MTRGRAAIVYRAAAGPRVGYGHLVRIGVLRRALGLPSVLSLRGSSAAARVANRFGWRMVSGAPRHVLADDNLRLLVIDDPSMTAAGPWCREARRRHIPVASIHDLGLGLCDADLTIDGSVSHPAGLPRGASLLGPRYLVLAPTTRRWKDLRRPAVLIALGGGPRRRAGLALARALVAARPGLDVRIAGGLATEAPAHLPAGVSWLPAQHGLAPALTRATVAVLGGGMSLYEACRVGTPAVGVAVVAAQRPTIMALAARHAAVDGGALGDSDLTIRQVLSLLDDGRTRERMSRRGRCLVDGRGASRVTARLSALVASAAQREDGRAA